MTQKTIPSNTINITKVFLFTIVVYMYIYGPPFKALPINISNIISILLTIIYIINNGSISSILNFKYEIIFLIILGCWMTFVSIIGDSLLYSPFIMITYYFSSIYIYKFVEKNFSHDKFEAENFTFKIIVLSSFAASLISIYLLLSPGDANYIKFNLLKYDETMMANVSHRGYGLSDELLYSFAISQAIVFAVILEKYKFSLFSLLFTILTIATTSINARIGTIYTLTAVLLYLTLSKNKLKTFALFAIALITFRILLIILSDISEINIIEDQIIFLWEDLSGKSEFDTFSALRSMLIIPDNLLTLIFGSGTNIFLKIGSGSDIGYIILLNYGGIVLLLLFSVYWILIAKKIWSLKPSIYYFLILMAIVFTANYKGLFFDAKPGTRTFLIIYISLVLQKKYSSKITSTNQR